LLCYWGSPSSAADRIIDHVGPVLALRQRKQFRTDTVRVILSRNPVTLDV
jgi:hypothetical protein